MLPWYQNIPFVCIFLCMISGITMPLHKRGKGAFAATVFVCFAVAALSAVLLGILYTENLRFTFKMGITLRHGETRLPPVRWKPCCACCFPP